MRLDRVNALVTAFPGDFEEEARKLDHHYSAGALYERSKKEEVLLTQAVAQVPGSEPRIDRDSSRLIRTYMIPSTLHGNSLSWWELPLHRWEVVLFNLLDGKLPLGVPTLTWPICARVLLTYWITCDPRAEEGPPLSEFQRWPWETGDVFERATMIGYVQDWSLFNRAVDLALALAERRGLTSSQAPDSGGEKPDQTTGGENDARHLDKLIAAAITDGDPTPLTEQERAVLELIVTLPANKGIIGRKICEKLAAKGVYLDESGLTKRIIPVLKRRCGVQNKARRGYFIPPRDGAQAARG